jgi:hypothetical protein
MLGAHEERPPSREDGRSMFARDGEDYSSSLTAAK